MHTSAIPTSGQEIESWKSACFQGHVGPCNAAHQLLQACEGALNGRLVKALIEEFCCELATRVWPVRQTARCGSLTGFKLLLLRCPAQHIIMIIDILTISEGCAVGTRLQCISCTGSGEDKVESLTMAFDYRWGQLV